MKTTEVGYIGEIKPKKVCKLNSGDIFFVDIYTFINEQDELLKNAYILSPEQAIDEMGTYYLEGQPYNCITFKMK